MVNLWRTRVVGPLEDMYRTVRYNERRFQARCQAVCR